MFMRRLFAFMALLPLVGGGAQAAEWRVTRIVAPARVLALDTVAGAPRVNAGGLWYALALDKGAVTLRFIDAPQPAKPPDGVLPGGRVVAGTRDIARAWLAAPTDRYSHAVFGHRLAAGSLVIETRAGKRFTVRLKDDAVFEDLAPRLGDLDGDGRDEIVLVKSYLRRGAALAVIAQRRGNYEVVAETPPLGQPGRWLAPAGFAPFTGDGMKIALVRQPHTLGALELWEWRDGRLQKLAALAGFANHVAGSDALAMSAAADFDGDGAADLALPSFDRTQLRIVSFKPEMHEIAAVPLPAPAATDLALIPGPPPLIALGLADGSLVTIGRN